ncbi:MAG: L-glyceraldehyde 3-phosphate reductase [Treponema sp. CETP13]|nr:MAG: L-glyceraldehyde 3-phosphate reductase [Treponema sp. CETP13]
MFKANESRYNTMQYQNCGKSGLKLPRVSLGLWHNFGTNDNFENQKKMVHTAFDAGITHFDLANNYGPEAGSAEENFGKIMSTDMKPYRDEMIISSKAGYYMWPGPYGDHGSRKYLMASCDQSLKRLNLDYVDIFYHHRPDSDTPLEETMNALSDIVKSGKALYVGISNYNAEQSLEAARILKANGTPLLINQVRYNMLDRWIEKDGLLDTLSGLGAGCICFSPLAQGLLTTKYLQGIPAGSRASLNKFLHESDVTQDLLSKITRLNKLAQARGQTLAQLALSWVLRKNRVTSVLIGASNSSQILDNCGIVEHLDFTDTELDEIEEILT